MTRRMEIVRCFLLLILVFLEHILGFVRIDPLVDTKIGLIKGVVSSDGYSMFMGIPYAKVNESNPFGNAIPFPRLENTFEAIDDSAICPQVNDTDNNILGILDCLHLNIYVPNTASSRNRLPVMIWMHGGSFLKGFSGRYTYGPGFLVKHDVILVTFNYRVGPYGFMCVDVPEVGNQGLKDQLLAMRWINQNIEAFGGNVNQITIFGESAGGHSVDLHLLSPKETLYNKVIIQSGSAQAATVLIKPDKTAPLKLAAYLGYNTPDIKESLTFLANIDTNLVIAASHALDLVFKPCVETQFDKTDIFINESWVTAKVPKVANMPILIGFNKDEMMMRHENKNVDHFDNLEIFSGYLRQTFNFSGEKFDTMHDIIRHFYLGDEQLSEKVKLDIIKFDSDFTYIHPIHRTIRKYVENGVGKLFFYMFAYEGQRNLHEDSLNVPIKGAGHADELAYLFDMQSMTEEPTEKDQLLIDQMTTMWTNFAKYSDPTPQTSELLPTKWIPINEDSLNYLQIDKELTIGSRPLYDRMAFWDLFYKLNNDFQINFQFDSNE